MGCRVVERVGVAAGANLLQRFDRQLIEITPAGPRAVAVYDLSHAHHKKRDNSAGILPFVGL